MATELPFSLGSRPAQPDPMDTPAVKGYLNYFEQQRARALSGIQETGQAVADILSNPVGGGYENAAPVVGRGPGGEFYVQGQTIKPGDFASHVQAEGLLDQPRQGQLPAGYSSLSPQLYREYIASIKNPTTGTLASRAFGRGVDVMQQNFGRAAQVAGFEGWGNQVAESNAEELRMTSPYARSFADSSFGDAAISTLAGVVPQILGTAAAATAGGLTAGPWGAGAGALAVNFPQALGDVAERQIEETGKIDRWSAVGHALPYALLDTASEALPVLSVAGKLAKVTKAGLKPVFGAGYRAGVKEVGKRIVVGGGVGALTEGATEAGQQVLVRRGAGQDLWSPEARAEYTESAIAGGFVGGFLGAGGRVFTRAPAQTGETVSTSEPADLLNQPSQRALPPPGAPSFPSGGSRRPDFWGSNQTGRGVGPYFGRDPNIVDAEWTDVTDQSALPPAGPRGLPPGPGGPLALGGPAAPLQIAGPTDPDLFGGSRYTDPGTPPPTPPAGGGAGLSTAEFYNQTPMGQLIADQLISEHTPRAPTPPAPLPTSASGGSLADMLATVTGRQTPDQAAAAAAQGRADISNEAVAAAGEQAYEELGYPGVEVGQTRGVADFRRGAMALLRGAGRKAAAGPTKAALTTQLEAVADALPKGLRAKLANRIRLTKNPDKLAEIAAEIAKHTKALPASHQPAGAEPDMAFGTTGGVRLKRGAGKAVAAVAAKAGALKRGKAPLQSPKVLGDKLFALRTAMTEAEFNSVYGKLRAAMNGNVKALTEVQQQLDQIEAEYNANESPFPQGPVAEETSATPGAALRRGRQGPAPALIQIGGTEPFVGTTSKTSTPPHSAAREAALTEEVEGLPESTSENMVAAIYKYLDENRYDMAETFITAAKQGKDISRVAMDQAAIDAQKAKIDYQRPQKFADTDIEGGVDEAMANYQSAINILGTARGKKAAKLTPARVTELQRLARGNTTVEQLRARILEYVTRESLDNALGARANKQATAEGKGDTQPTPPKKADPLDAAVAKLKEQWGLSDKSDAAAEAVAESTITPVDEQAVLDKLTKDERATIGDEYDGGLYSAKAKRAFLDDFTKVINKQANKASKAIKEIIRRIATGAMAMAMVFNPAALTNVSQDFLFAKPAQAATINAPPAGIDMSSTASLSYTRLSGMAQGRVLIIVDKPAGQIHFFNKDGSPMASAPVLTGASKNDTLPQNVTQGSEFSTQQILDIPVEERVTPAGVFTTAKSKDGTFLWLNDAQGQSHQIAIHNTEIKSRLPRFTTNSAGDNMVSYGCVNISPEMYENTIKDDIDKFNNAVVFVVPHDLSKAEALLPKAQAQEARREAPPLRPPPQDTTQAEAPPLREEDYLGEPGQATEEARPSPVFSREDTTAFVGDGMAQSAVDAELKAATKGWKSPPEIHSHKDWNSIPEQYKKRVSKTSKGFFDRTTGAVHIIAANIADAADVRSTLYHEALGHFGLWNRFTTRLGPMLVKMYQTNQTVRTEADKYLAARNLPSSPAAIALAVEETLAEWFSPGAVRLSAWQNIKSYVRNMGRTMGMAVDYSDTDVASVMHKAQQYTMRSDGPVTMMEHNEAMGPAVLMRDWGVAETMSKSPPWLRDNAQSRWTSTRDAFASFAQKGMLTNQLLDDFLPSLGATRAKAVASLVRFRDAMTNGLMKGSREWAAAMENEPLSWRERSMGIGKPALTNFSGFVETARRRGKWGFIPDDGRFPVDDATVEERFRRGEFNAKNEQVADALIDPELEAAFNAFTPSQQKLVRQFYFETWNARESERKALYADLNKTYDGAIADAKVVMDEAEYDAGIRQAHAEREGATALDKSMAKKKTKEYEAAKAKYESLVDAKDAAVRGLNSTYRNMEYTPYAPMSRHGGFVIVAKSAALKAAEAARDRAKEAGQKYETPEGQPSIYAMEADPDHYFVHAVDSRHDAVRMVTELQKNAPEFSGGDVRYSETAKVGQEVFKGSDVIAGLSKIIGNLDASGETQATNNILLEIAKRTILDAMSQNSAKKADMHFRNIRSAPLDMPKAFMSRMLSSSQFLSGHYHNAKINKALTEAMDQIDDRRYVADKNAARAKAGLLEFVGRYNDDMTPKANDTMADKLTGFSSLWMLIASPSYYAQQAAQNLVITAPYLAGRFNPAAVTAAFKIGYAQTAKALEDTGGGSKRKGALNFLANGMIDLSGVDPQYREVIRYLESVGVIDVSANLEMGRVSSDVSSGRMDKVNRVLRNSVRGIESGNRISAGIASFHLMHAQGRVTPETLRNLLGVDQKAFDQRYQDYLANHETMGKYADQAKEPMPPAMSKDEFAAAEYARQVILDTHGDYSSSNKPVWTRTGIWRVATQFRTFNAMMVGTYAKTFSRAFLDANLSKEERAIARRTIGYMLGNTALFAGAAGLPVSFLFSGLAMTLGMFDGDDEEPPEDWQNNLREWVGDSTIANLLIYGVPTLIGVNVSGSMGLGNMFTMVPGKDAPSDKESFTAWALALLGGPTAAMGTRIYDAKELWFDKGQTYKAMHVLMPKFLQGPAQAIHDMTVGEYTRSGVQLMRPEEISAAEAAWGALGFQGADRSARKWAIGRSIDEDQYFSSTGASIKRSFVEAKAAGDGAGMNEARENWKALQASRQKFGLKQQPISQLGSAAKKAATDTKNVTGGIPYSAATKGQALRLGQLAGQ